MSQEHLYKLEGILTSNSKIPDIFLPSTWLAVIFVVRVLRGTIRVALRVAYRMSFEMTFKSMFHSKHFQVTFESYP